MKYQKIYTSKSYPKKPGTYFAFTERGVKTVIEWTGEITIGWRNIDWFLEEKEGPLKEEKENNI